MQTEGPPAKTQRRKEKRFVISTEWEKSFLEPSHSLGMTGLARHLAGFAPWRDKNFL
jgi:hypothetical protein